VAIPALIAASLGQAGLEAYSTRELARRSPFENSAGPNLQKLNDASEEYLAKTGRTPLKYKVKTNVPAEGIEGLQDVYLHGPKYAGTGPLSNGTPAISINPNADSAYFAHELGHMASRKFDFGGLVSNLRANPKLKGALFASMLTIPGVAAALEDGDEDLDTSLAAALLSQAPVFVDEALADKHAYAIMDTAGMRASLGQRGKMAAGLLNYAAAPLLAGVSANYVGNLFDQDIPVG